MGNNDIMISYFDGWLQVRICEGIGLLVPLATDQCDAESWVGIDMMYFACLGHQRFPYLSELGAAQYSNATPIRSQPPRASAQLHPLRGAKSFLLSRFCVRRPPPHWYSPGGNGANRRHTVCPFSRSIRAIAPSASAPVAHGSIGLIVETTLRDL